MAERAVEIDEALVRALIAAQFPEWAALPVRAVEPGGWDNRTFRLGDAMTVRLPSAAGYVPQVAKEQRWLPWLAPRLPLPIPRPLALGAPALGYPWPWSVYQWIEGESALVAPITELPRVALALARFLTSLQSIAATDGPPAGAHSFYRGASLEVYDSETRRAIARLDGMIDAAAATAVWEAARAAEWHGPPVWFHGDVAAGNLLVRDGELSAVIDFGCTGVGDPACDLAIAWTFFAGESRAAFHGALPLDAGAWARGRGWALWKALITLDEYRESDRAKADEAHHVLNQVLSDPVHRRD